MGVSGVKKKGIAAGVFIQIPKCHASHRLPAIATQKPSVRDKYMINFIKLLACACD